MGKEDTAKGESRLKNSEEREEVVIADAHFDLDMLTKSRGSFSLFTATTSYTRLYFIHTNIWHWFTH